MSEFKQLPLVIFAYILMAYPIVHSSQHSDVDAHKNLVEQGVSVENHDHDFTHSTSEKTHHSTNHTHLDISATFINGNNRDGLKQTSSYSIYFANERKAPQIKLAKKINCSPVTRRPTDPFRYSNLPLLI